MIAFLFLLAFGPTVDVIRRYRQNWHAKAHLFTIVESAVLFILGWIGSALLNGSLPHLASAYSHAARMALSVWLLPCAVFLISTFLLSFREPGPRFAEPPRDDLIDVPITDDNQDTLDRLSFVDDFYGQIRLFRFEDSFVFGLNGPWGSGKTSVLNLLRNRLRNDKNIILVDFNPWYFQSSETIIRQFYDSIARSINREFFYPQLRSIARRYARILTPVLKRYGIELVQGDEATVEEVKAMVESYIVDTGRRVVVIIDDLERAHDNELVTVLQIVRLSAELQEHPFGLAYDQMQLFCQLNRLGISADFLEKSSNSRPICQLPTKTRSIGS